MLQRQGEELVYGLKRAGPRNFDKFFVKNFIGKRLTDFNYASYPIKDVYSLPIDEITSIEIKDENSSEVMLLIETMRGSFSIQPTANPCQNLFAYYLCKQLNIDVPLMRIVAYQEKEYRAIVWKVESATFENVQFQTRVLNVLNKPFWMIRQYFPSLSIDKLEGSNSRECLNANFPRGRHRLIQIGFLCAVDMLLNNPNRVPILGSYPGSPKNLTFKIDNSDGLLTSDQVVNPTRRLDFDDLLIFKSDINTVDKLKDDKSLTAFNSHTTEVETLVESCCLHLRDIMFAKVEPTMQSDYHFSTLDRVRLFISQTSGYELTTMGEFQLLLGIVIGFQMIIRFGPEKIRRTLSLIKKSRSADPKGHWLSDLASLNQDFFANTISKVDRILLRFDDVLAYSHSVTVEQFNLHFGEDLSPSILQEMSVWCEPGAIDTQAVKTAADDRQREIQAMIDERDRVIAQEREEVQKAKEEGNRLVDFEEIDKKIESMFGLKMGEFMKEDDDILGRSVGGQSSIRRKPDSLKDDTVYKDIADDLKSKKTGKSQKSGLESKEGKSKITGKESKNGTVSRRSGKTPTQEEEEEEEEEQEQSGEYSKASKTNTLTAKGSKKSKFSEPKKESKNSGKKGTSKRSNR